LNKESAHQKNKQSSADKSTYNQYLSCFAKMFYWGKQNLIQLSYGKCRWGLLDFVIFDYMPKSIKIFMSSVFLLYYTL